MILDHGNLHRPEIACICNLELYFIQTHSTQLYSDLLSLVPSNFYTVQYTALTVDAFNRPLSLWAVKPEAGSFFRDRF